MARGATLGSMGIRLRVRSSWDENSPAVSYSFGHDRVSIGRGAGVDVQLPHPAVSSLHATLRQSGAGYTIVDEGSTNGTLVNATTLVALRPKPLRSGDRIELGGFALDVEMMPIGESTSAGETALFARQLVRAIVVQGERPAEAAALLVTNGPNQGTRHLLPAPPARLVVGRAEQVDVTIDDADASREHAELVHDHRGLHIHDLGSKNGVLLNGVRVETSLVRDRDELQIGATVLVYDDPAAAAVAAISAADDLVTEVPRARDEIESSDPKRAEDAPHDRESAAGARESTNTPSDSTDSQGESGPREPARAPTSDEAPATLLDEPSPRPLSPQEPASIPIGGAQRSSPGATPGASFADVLLYGLAIVVTLVSIAGLVWLLG